MKNKLLKILLAGFISIGAIGAFVACNNNSGPSNEQAPPIYEKPEEEEDEGYTAYPVLNVVESISLYKTQTYNLQPNVTLDGVAVQATITYSSANSEVATVENGVVTAVGVGSAQITVTAVYGEETLTKTVSLTILPEAYLEFDESVNVTATSNRFNMINGQSSNIGYKLYAFGEEMTMGAMITVEDPTIVTASDNTLTPIKAGKTIATVSYNGEILDTVDIVIYETIENATELLAIPEDGYFAIVNNIDGAGAEFAGFKTFNGEINAFGHTISNLTLTGNALFENIAENALLENASFKNIMFDEDIASGAIIANTNNGTIKNVYVDTVLIGENSAAIAVNNNGTIANSIVSIQAAETEAGAVAVQNNGAVQNVYAFAFGNAVGKVQELTKTNNIGAIFVGDVYTSGKDAKSVKFDQLGFEGVWETEGLNVPLMKSLLNTETYELTGVITSKKYGTTPYFTIDYANVTITDMFDNDIVEKYSFEIDGAGNYMMLLPGGVYSFNVNCEEALSESVTVTVMGETKKDVAFMQMRYGLIHYNAATAARISASYSDGKIRIDDSKNNGSNNLFYFENGLFTENFVVEYTYEGGMQASGTYIGFNVAKEEEGVYAPVNNGKYIGLGVGAYTDSGSSTGEKIYPNTWNAAKWFGSDAAYYTKGIGEMKTTLLSESGDKLTFKLLVVNKVMHIFVEDQLIYSVDLVKAALWDTFNGAYVGAYVMLPREGAIITDYTYSSNPLIVYQKASETIRTTFGRRLEAGTAKGGSVASVSGLDGAAVSVIYGDKEYLGECTTTADGTLTIPTNITNTFVSGDNSVLVQTTKGTLYNVIWEVKGLEYSVIHYHATSTEEKCAARITTSEKNGVITIESAPSSDNNNLFVLDEAIFTENFSIEFTFKGGMGASGTAIGFNLAKKGTAGGYVSLVGSQYRGLNVHVYTDGKSSTGEKSYVHNWGSNQWWKIANDAGAFTNVTKDLETSYLSGNDEHTFKIVVENKVLKFYVDGNHMYTVDLVKAGLWEIFQGSYIGAYIQIPTSGSTIFNYKYTAGTTQA